MQLSSNSHAQSGPAHSTVCERSLLRKLFSRSAEETLNAFFRERDIAEELAPRLLTETLDEAVKQFPCWIRQVALICHLTSHYREDLRRYLASLVGEVQADDLAQETLLNAIIAIRKGAATPTASKTKAWLLMIGTNLVRDAMRKRKARREQALHDVNQCDLAEKETNADSRLDLREALEKIKGACDTRSTEIAMLLEAGFNKQEIASRQKVSGRTIERRLRALSAALGRFARAA